MFRKASKAVRRFAKNITKRARRFFGRGGNNEPVVPLANAASAPVAPPVEVAGGPPAPNAPATPPPAGPPLGGPPAPVIGPPKRRHRRRKTAFRRVKNVVRGIGKKFRNTVSKVFRTRRRK